MSSYNNNKKLTVINFFGGPGTGKSTTAAGLFHLMKRKHYNVELVTEFAKDLVWAERNNMFSEQDYILAKQNNRLRRLVGKVEFAVTDCPILLGVFYAPADFPPSFKPFVREIFDSYTNINVFLERVAQYIPLGRVHTEEQANMISEEIQQYLDTNQVQYIKYPATDDVVEQIFGSVVSTNVCSV